MGQLYICNAFSLNMLGEIPPAGRTIKVRPLTLEEVRSLLQQGQGYESAVGHEATASVISTLLGLPVEARRVAITLSPGDRVVVFQLRMRLEEGRILNKEEVESLYQQGLASFCLVEVGQ
jgi:hypothetical protein